MPSSAVFSRISGKTCRTIEQSHSFPCIRSSRDIALLKCAMHVHPIYTYGLDFPGARGFQRRGMLALNVRSSESVLGSWLTSCPSLRRNHLGHLWSCQLDQARAREVGLPRGCVFGRQSHCRGSRCLRRRQGSSSQQRLIRAVLPYGLDLPGARGFQRHGMCASNVRSAESVMGSWLTSCPNFRRDHRGHGAGVLPSGSGSGMGYRLTSWLRVWTSGA